MAAVRRRRPWTRAATVGTGAHILYELAAGVGMPLAARIGPGLAAALWSAGGVAAFRAAGRCPRSGDTAFAVLDGAFLAAVIAHFTGWPRTEVAGLPWLTECEGLDGRLMPPYNLILYASAIAAVGGLVENRRGTVWGAMVPVVMVPWLVAEQKREFTLMCAEAGQHPAWWNRRLGRR
jgi:hypothetical protein